MKRFLKLFKPQQTNDEATPELPEITEEKASPQPYIDDAPVAEIERQDIATPAEPVSDAASVLHPSTPANRRDLKYERRVLRRQIREDFDNIQNTDENLIKTLATLITTYEEHLELMREILAPYRNSREMKAVLITDYLSGVKSEQLNSVLVEQRLLRGQLDLIQSRLARLSTILIPVKLQGPELQAVSLLSLQTWVQEALGTIVPSVKLSGPFPIVLPGHYEFNVELNGVMSLAWLIEVQFDYPPIDAQLGTAFQHAQPIHLDPDLDVQEQLSRELTTINSDDVLTYFSVLEQVLFTAYNYGYWLTPAVQEHVVEWEELKSRYTQELEIRRLREQLAALIEREAFLLPDESSSESWKEKHLRAFVNERILSQVSAPLQNITIAEVNDRNSSGITIEVQLYKQTVASITLIQLSRFMPSYVSEEIEQAEILDELADLQNAKSPILFADLADQETRRAIEFKGQDSQQTREQRINSLAAILRISMRWLYSHDVQTQFKRTLTSYYLTKATYFFREQHLPIEARPYYLLYFRMLTRERMMEHMRSVRPIEYPALASFIATYAKQDGWKSLQRSKTELLRDFHTLNIEAEEPLLQRLVYHYHHASKASYFEALFELYSIDEVFVKNILATLWKVKAVGAMKVEQLHPTNNSYMNEAIQFALSYSLESEASLHEFLLTVLDLSEYSSNHELKVSLMVSGARKFIASTGDITQKYNLYGSFERSYQDARRVLDKVAGDSKVRRDESHKKKHQSLRQLLDYLLRDVDRARRSWFGNAKLDIQINTFTIPHAATSPVELVIENVEAGEATNISLTLERNATYQAQEYQIELDSLYGKETHYVPVYVTPLDPKTLELHGQVDYYDPDNKRKSTSFQANIGVSNPDTFKRFDPPYIPGVPIRDSNMFFGRREELDSIIRFLRGRFQDRVTVIFGRRRLGKTSLVLQIKEGNYALLEMPQLRDLQALYIPIHIDFERFTRQSQRYEFYDQIHRYVCFELEKLSITPRRIDTAQFAQSSAPDSLLLDHLMALRSDLGGKKLLFMLDEFDNLIYITRGDPEKAQIFAFIRELVQQHSDYISFIFVGADSMVKMMRDYAQRLFAIAQQPIELQPLSREETHELITAPMKKVEGAEKFEWDKKAVDYIYDLTQGHPQYIQVLCSSIVVRLIGGMRLRATWIDVDFAVKEVVNHAGLADFGNLTVLGETDMSGKVIEASDGITPLEKIMLTCIGDLTQHERQERFWVTGKMVEDRIHEVAPDFKSSVIPPNLDSLVVRGHLVRHSGDTEMEYRVAVPLIRIYVSHTFKLRDVLLEGGYL